jgi:uncharacterized damage-inducible protein DinB
MKLRTLSLLCCLLLTAGAVYGQTSSPPAFSASEAAKAGFAEVNDWIIKSAEMVPAEKYNYKPVDTVRTFGQLIAHVTDSYNFLCARGIGNKVEYSDAAEKGGTDKETLLPKLKEAVGRCTAAYDAKNADLRRLFANVSHTNLHYGNIITYLRMMGLKPPSS